MGQKHYTKRRGVKKYRAFFVLPYCKVYANAYNEGKKKGVKKMENKFKVGQLVKAYHQKARGYIIGRIQEIKEDGYPVIRPEAYEGGTKFYMEYIVSKKIFTLVSPNKTTIIG